jgi:hypothetical protein
MVCDALLELVVKGLEKPTMGEGHCGQWEELAMVPPLVCRSTNYEFEILYAQVVHEGIQILRFLSFATCFDASKTYNMLASMLDPKHKNLKSIANYVRKDVACIMIAQ